ncbi:MAG: tetratricopeptide repeat protein [Thermoleophilia bacterium]
MNTKYLIAIIVAAVVVVGLIVIIPNLGSDGTGVANTPTTGNGSAPPISPDATVPEGHPEVAGSDAQATGPTAEEIVATAEAAYKADPKNVEAILGLGDAYLQANRLDDATKVLNEALVIEPTNSTAKAGLAMVDFVKGDTAGAQSKLEAVVAEAPEDQVALYDLAIVYFSTDQRDKAKEMWAKVVEANPVSDLGQMAQQFVDMMGQTEASGGSPHGATTDTTAGATGTTTK